MLYYDIFNKVNVSESEIKDLGLSKASKKRLHELGFYELVISSPTIENPECEGLRPKGAPQPDPGNADVYVQRMEVYNFLDELKSVKKAEMVQRRWDAQCSNIVFDDGSVFKTHPDDVARLATTLQTAQAAGKITVDFKTANGWTTLDVPRLRNIHDVVANYVEDCYSNERRLEEALDAAKSLDELNAIDIQSGWPRNSFASDEETEEDLSRLVVEKSNEARIMADLVVAPYLSEFSDVEKQTWAKQQDEVAAYLADNSAPTPTLDGLAQSRGISREEMLEKAVAKVTAFEPLSVAIVGRQQAYEDMIKAIAADDEKTVSERIAEIRALEFDYSL